MKKEIKFSSISFNEIGIDGLIHHEYKWDKETEILTHFIDGVEFEKFNKSKAKKEIKKLIGTEHKPKTKPIQLEKDNTVITPINQLKLF